MSTAELKKAGKALIKSAGNPAFLPTEGGENLEALATELIDARSSQDAHLGYVLRELNGCARHLDRGYEDFNAYVEKELAFSAAKARGLIDGWNMFEDLGLNPGLLGSISWTKFCSLKPAYTRGLISKDNIVEWLPIIAREGDYAERVSDVVGRVRVLIADQSPSNVPPSKMEHVRLDVLAADMPDFQRNMEVVREKFGGGDATVLSNLAAFAASAVVDESVSTHKLGGLANLKATAERLYPGIIAVFLMPEDGEYTEGDLGVPPAIHVYRDPVTSACVLATSSEDAMDALGSAEGTVLEKHPILVSDAYQSASQEAEDIAYPHPSDFLPEEYEATLKNIAVQLKKGFPEAPQVYQAFVQSAHGTDPDKNFALSYEFLLDTADEHGITIDLNA